MASKRFVFTGGGTGGHVYPNIAIAETLKERFPDAEFLYIGIAKGSESRILPNLPHSIPLRFITSRGLPSSMKSLAALSSLFHILIGTLQSLLILFRFKPHLIISTGGFVAAPVVLAGRILKKKIFLHEQNSVPGRMNRLMARFADRIAVSFASTMEFFPTDKTVLTGYPLRRSLSAPDHAKNDQIRKRLAIPVKNKVVFIFSGSTGSRSINQAVAEIVPHLLREKDVTLIVSTGKSFSSEYKAYEETIKLFEPIGIQPEIKGKLIIREYFDEIDQIYAIADLVVARAGAGSINEITSLGLPVLFIPKLDLPGDHQIMNAREIETIGGASVIYEELTSIEGRRVIIVPEQELLMTIRGLLRDEKKRQEMIQRQREQPKLDSRALIASQIDALITRPPEGRREILTYYLHEEDAQANHEILFDSFTVGNTILADLFLDKIREKSLFEIKFLNKAAQGSIILKRISGEVAVNDQPVEKWSELKVGDKIAAGGRLFELNSFQESIQTHQADAPAVRRMIGSSMGIMLSRVGGFFREVVIARIFGATKAVDLFSVGLNISNLIRRIVAENALDNVFLPIFVRLFNRSPRKTTWRSASSIINFTVLAAVLFTVIGILFTPQIIRFIIPGFVEKGYLNDAVRMTQIMFPYLVLVTIASAMASLLKAFNRFGLAEGSAVFYSIGTLIGIFMLQVKTGIFALGWGVLIGGLLQILFLFPLLYKLLSQKSFEFFFSPKIHFQGTATKKYIAQLTPVTADVTISQIGSLVDKRFAAYLPTGSLSILYYAGELFRLPFSIISQSINSVVLKDFSEHFSLFDREKAKKLFLDGITINIFLLAPISILMIMLAPEIVSMIFQGKKFTADAVLNTAWALKFYSLGLVGWGIHNLTMRVFAARLDIKTSLYINFFMMLVNIALCYILVRTPLQFAGIALATTIAYSLFSLIRIYVLKRKLASDQITIANTEIVNPLAKTLAACLLMIIALLEGDMILRYIRFDSRFLGNLIRFTSLSFLGLSVYFLTAMILRHSGILFFRKRKHTRKSAIPVSHLSPFAFLETVSRDPHQFRETYRFKIGIYLASNRWEIRNIGIKLIGLFQESRYANLLESILKNPQEPGFTRRNALVSLRSLNVWNESICSLVHRLISDKYYEVRAAALQYLAEHLDKSTFPPFRVQILARMRHGTLEEKLAAIRLIARSGTIDDLSAVQKLFLDSNSLIREELLELLAIFYRRKLIGREELTRQMRKFLITSNNLIAEFKIKSIIQRILADTEET